VVPGGLNVAVAGPESVLAVPPEPESREGHPETDAAGPDPEG